MKSQTATTKPRTAKDDRDLAAWPIAILNKREIYGEASFVGKDNQGKPCSWTLRGSPLPTAHDEGVYVALAELTREQGKVGAPLETDGRVFFTHYALAQKLGWAISGRTYQRIRKALERLHGVQIIARNAYHDPVTRQKGDKLFHLLDEAVLYPEKAAEYQEGFPFSWIVWSREVRNHYLAGWVKNLDVERYFGLRDPTARTLYRYLDLRNHDGKPVFRIGVEALGQHIGLLPPATWRTKDGRTKPSWYRQKLDPAHKELVAAGFLAAADYEELVDGRPAVRYVFASVADRLPDGILGDLIAFGVNPSVAEKMVGDHAEERIREQMAWLPFRGQPKSKSAMLVAAIRDAWAAPESWVKREQAEREREALILRWRRVEEQKTLEADTITGEIGSLTDEDQQALHEEAEARAAQKYRFSGPGRPGWDRLVETEAREIIRERLAGGADPS